MIHCLLRAKLMLNGKPVLLFPSRNTQFIFNYKFYDQVYVHIKLPCKTKVK